VSNEDIGFIEGYFLKKNVRLSAKGRRWAENAEALTFYAGILVIFAIVGSIETGKWF
jgi:hypothetical protein